MNYLTTDTDLTAIANAIRAKVGVQGALMYPDDFIDFIGELVKPTGTKNITENGTNIDVASYAKVNVSVSGSTIRYKSAEGSYNIINNVLCVDFSQGTRKRQSFWQFDGNIPVKEYFGISKIYTNDWFHPIIVPSGATQVEIEIGNLSDTAIQARISEYTVVNDEVTAEISSSGWVNITPGTPLTYQFSGSPGALGVSFRKDANNTQFTDETCVYDFDISFE